VSRPAVILQFPSGERLPPDDEEQPRDRKKWLQWLAAALVVAVVVATTLGALTRPTPQPTPPPAVRSLHGVLTLRSVRRVCAAHPDALFHASLRGVLYDGLAERSTVGTLFGGAVAPSTVLNPEFLAHSHPDRMVLISAWPDHERTLDTGYWIILTGVLNCSSPAQLEYLNAKYAAV
jgi:hypothetical protein